MLKAFASLTFIIIPGVILGYLMYTTLGQFTQRISEIAAGIN